MSEQRRDPRPEHQALPETEPPSEPRTAQAREIHAQQAAEPSATAPSAASSADAAAQDVQQEDLHKLHPATIAIEFVRRLWGMAYYIALAFFLRFMGEEREGPAWVDYVIIGLTLLGVIGAVLRYVSFRYAIVGEHLIVRSGILSRQHRTIPIAKIQNIDLKRTVLHRALGVVDIKIETAGGAKPEGDLSALGIDAADRLKQDLLRRRAAARAREDGAAEAADATPAGDASDPASADTAAAGGAAENGGRVIWTATTRDLLLAGATENRVGLIFAGVAGIYYTFQQVLFRFIEPVVQGIEDAAGAATTMTIALIVTGLAVAVIAIGWLLSIILTFVQFYQFKLTEADERLRRHYGLLTNIESVVPLRRVQVVRMQAPLLRRLIRRRTVFADTASTMMNEEGSSGGAPICPLLHDAQTTGFCQHVFPEFTFDALDWRPVSKRTIQRFAVRVVLVGGIALGALAVGWDERVLWGFVPLVALAYALGYWRYRMLGYAEQGNFVATRGGLFTRREWVIPHGKVQAVHVSANPFQQRLGLASIEIQTAGATFSAAAGVPDLPRAEAERLQEKLSVAAHAAGPWLLDGV